MADIGEFAQRAAKQFAESQRSVKKPSKLQLERRTVEDFIKTVYYASMIPDEGRFPLLTLMSYARGSETTFHFPFPNRIRPSALQIAKLAHATAPSSHVCCICDNGEILLGGIHVTVLNELRELGYGSERVANPLKLVIRGPGHVEMSTGRTALIYRSGEIAERNLFQDSFTLKILAEVTEQELRELAPGSVGDLQNVFNDLTEAIMQLGHGGMLIVAREPKGNQFSSLRVTDSLLLQELLIRYWHDVARLVTGTGAADEIPDIRNNPHALNVASDSVMLGNGVKSIAALAGMDGAIVMDYGCKVVGFNGIIKRSESAPVGRQLVDELGTKRQPDEILSNRGSRHQSAMSYAMAVPHSFVFVISQDGGISAFHNPGDGRVVCEMGMRVLD